MGQKRLGELFPAFSLYLSIIVAQTNWQESSGGGNLRGWPVIQLDVFDNLPLKYLISQSGRVEQQTEDVENQLYMAGKIDWSGELIICKWLKHSSVAFACKKFFN